jgi:hypothetical protein
MANYTSAYDQLMRNSRTLLVNLRRQIAAREAELKRLRDEEHRLGSLVRPGADRRTGRRTRATARRTDWQAVLAKTTQAVQSRGYTESATGCEQAFFGSIRGDYALDRSGGGEAE